MYGSAIHRKTKGDKRTLPKMSKCVVISQNEELAIDVLSQTHVVFLHKLRYCDEKNTNRNAINRLNIKTRDPV